MVEDLNVEADLAEIGAFSCGLADAIDAALSGK